MRRVPELMVFIGHADWWDYSKDRKYYVPTKKAPPEAVEAIKKVNEKIKKNAFA